MPLSQRTDGVWRWDDAVSYYVRRYGLNPSTEFLGYLHQRGFVPPTPSPERLSEVASELFGTSTSAHDRQVKVDGTQLLPRDSYCIHRGRVFVYSWYGRGHTQVRLSVRPGEQIPAGFEPGDTGSAASASAYLVLPVADIDAFFRVVTTCLYKGGSFSITEIHGTKLTIQLGGGRRIKSTLPRPAQPSLDEWHQFSNMEVWGPNEIAGHIDILEAAQITMAIVPYHMSGGRLVATNDPTGYGYAVPTADEIFYFPSPADSPFLPTKDAIATIGAYLATHDPAYPTTDFTPLRLRDGWRMNTTHSVNTIYNVADDGYIFAAPHNAPVDQVSSQLSADFRRRHPVIDPPPKSDTGTEIFD
ncbi:hypothetical protein [Mycobacteroides saopaulense]|uniref:hypothetical protein n=1 Tax=Mycobacteroides saopaulense TaxID=1578165 RepID=UPI001F1FD44F|nr:hypothetical protein [Mycobacteroides saopaulense]